MHVANVVDLYGILVVVGMRMKKEMRGGRKRGRDRDSREDGGHKGKGKTRKRGISHNKLTTTYFGLLFSLSLAQVAMFAKTWQIRKLYVEIFQKQKLSVEIIGLLEGRWEGVCTSDQ